MPTNEERREVADRFRDFETLRPIFKESNICAFLEALGVKGYWSWEDICEKLADLIEPEPERTCRNDSKVGSNSPGWLFDFKCSECGAELCAEEMGNSPLWVDGDAETISYCPNCGAKVIE